MGVVWAPEVRVDLPHERSSSVPVRFRQGPGRRRAQPGDKILSASGEICYPRKYTSEEKIRILLEGFRRAVTVNDLCRREGIKPHSYYSWTKDYGIQSQPMVHLYR